MKKVIDTIVRIMMLISMSLVFVLTFIQVISRYVFHFSIPWAQDVVRMSFVYMVFFGAAYCISIRNHISVDLLVSTMPEKVRSIYDIILSFIVLAFLCLLFIQGIKFVSAGKLQMASYIKMPMSWFYLATPLSMLFSVYYTIVQIIEDIKALKKQH